MRKPLSRKRRRKERRQWDRTDEGREAAWINGACTVCRCWNPPCDGVLAGSICDNEGFPRSSEADDE